MKVPRILLFSLLVFAAGALAQDDNDNPQPAAGTADGDNTPATPPPPPPPPPKPPTPPPAPATPPKPPAPAAPPKPPTNDAEPTNDLPKAGETTSPKTTPTPSPKTTPSASKPPVVITGSNTVNGDSGDLPNVTSEPPLPKASEDRGFSIPDISPPPTKNAPFMRQSNLPEGTVFIAVGAVLAFFALVVIAWRGLVAWSLHRSVKRATAQSGIMDTKSMMRPHFGGGKGGAGGGFYAAGPGSTLSLDHLGSSNRSPGAGPNSSLFFSPTSNSAAPPPTSGISGDRRSAYLPAGFYATGNRKSSVPSNASQTHFNRARGPGVSPPGTPLMAPASRGGASSTGTERMSGMRINDSQTSLNLPPTGRAPSAYLEGLFESHQMPSEHQMPPPPQAGRF